MTRLPGSRLVAAIVLGHTSANLAHGLPHLAVPVELAPWQETFVALVAMGLPLAGLGLLWRGRIRLGSAALIVGGVGSASFGTFFHFVAETPDHVANVTGAWSEPFSLTALAISVLALATAAMGAWLLVVSS